MLPITSLQLNRQASAARVSLEIARLDEKLGSKDVLGGSSMLVSGSPGTGKNSIAFGNRSQRIGAPRPRAGHTGGCALRISK
jgi:predicted ATP-dependent serine protease